MFELGSVYPASLNVYDQNNNPVNASTVTLTITLPDGTTTSPSVTNPATGQYTASYLTIEPGRHTVRWVTTIPNTAYSDVFDVTYAQPQSIISLADARQQIGLTDPTYTTDDVEIRMWMRATTRALENYKHEAIVSRQVIEEFRIGGFWWRSWPSPFGGGFRLTTVPVIALQALQSLDGTVTWDPANFDLDQSTGLVNWVAGPPVQGAVNAMYLAGMQVIPENYLIAGRMLFQHMWETRRGPGGASGVVGPEELQDYRHYTSLPRKVTEMIGPPRPTVM